MSARTGFKPRMAGSDQFEVGDVVVQRVGLHCHEPNARWKVTKISACNISVIGVTDGRGSKNRSRTFSYPKAKAASMFVIVRKASPGKTF